MLSFPPAVYAQTKEWGNCVVDGVPTLKCLEVVIENLITAATGFIVLVLFIMFVFGSYQYLTSLGNPERIKKAQATFRWALMGFILFIGAFLILNVLDILFLGGSGRLLKLNLEIGN